MKIPKAAIRNPNYRLSDEIKKYKRAAVKYFKDREFYDGEYYVTINGKEKEYKLSDLMADFMAIHNDGALGKFETLTKK